MITLLDFRLKSLLSTAAFSIITGLLSFSNLYAQNIETRKVQFERGKSSATIEGSISGDQIVDYTLNVREGQLMNVSMATDNTGNYFNIMEPNEGNVAIFNGSTGENMFEGVLEKSGDYRIRVYLMRSAARRIETANYRLEMSISAFNQVQPKVEQEDALVPGTNYNATGKIPCIITKGQPTGNCDFGVVREGNGNGMVTITKPDGRTRTIFFKDGNATGYDMSQADPGEFNATKESDLYIIQIGDERYELPEAIILGG